MKVLVDMNLSPDWVGFLAWDFLASQASKRFIGRTSAKRWAEEVMTFSVSFHLIRNPADRPEAPSRR